MNKMYVLNNLLDESLFLKDNNNDTRTLSESKKFINRKLAENYIERNKLTEKYSVKLIPHQSVKLGESVDKNSINKELESVIDDTKDMIDMSLEYIQEMMSVNEECFNGTNIEDALDRLRKLKKSASIISFRPAFYDSGVKDKNTETTETEINSTGGESSGKSN